MLQLNDALGVATADGGPKDALRSEIEWRLGIKALIAMIVALSKKIQKQTLPGRAAFYVSGAHHEPYGSIGHPHDILAVTDDATEVAFFYGRKGMDVAFRVQCFKDVIKLVASSIWTAKPTAEQRQLAVLVLNAWGSHASGEPTNCSLLTPQHACGGVSWLRATAISMGAGALAPGGTTPIGAGGAQRREANIHAICMWLLRGEAGPLQVEEQQCRLLSDEEYDASRQMHLDCPSACRGRCGSTNGVPKQTVITGDNAECLCVFGGASRCWVPARAQRAPTLTGTLPTPPDKAAAKGAAATDGSLQQVTEQVTGAQPEASGVLKPAGAVDVDAKTPDPKPGTLEPAAEVESEVEQDGCAGWAGAAGGHLTTGATQVRAHKAVLARAGRRLASAAHHERDAFKSHRTRHWRHQHGGWQLRKQGSATLEREASNRGYTERNRVAADPAVPREWPCVECDQDGCLR